MMNSIKVNYVALGITAGVALLIIIKVYSGGSASLYNTKVSIIIEDDINH